MPQIRCIKCQRTLWIITAVISGLSVTPQYTTDEQVIEMVKMAIINVNV